MTVIELIDRLEEFEKNGYGNATVMVMNLNMQDYEDVAMVELIKESENWHERAIEIR